MRRRRLLLPLHTIRESTRNIFKFRSSINHKIVVNLFCQLARSVFLFIFCSDDVVFTVIFHIHILSLITIRIMRWNIFYFNFEHSTFLCFLSQFRSVLKKAVLFPRVSCFIACSVKIFKWRKRWYLLEYPCISGDILLLVRLEAGWSGSTWPVWRAGGGRGRRRDILPSYSTSGAY